MDSTQRYMTKIVREVNKFTVQTMKEEGIGTAEFDFIHYVRHNPGVTQAKIREELKLDKGAAARRTAALEAKGYLIRKENPNDHRSSLLYATPKADTLKNSKVQRESLYYEWLMEHLTDEEQKSFTDVLDKIYLISKKESRAGFPNLKDKLEKL